MPAPIADNGILDHLDILAKILSPVIGVVIAVIVWAWRKMEVNIDKIEETIDTHVKSDDLIHDKLFNQQRETEATLNQLKGEHDQNNRNHTH